MRLDDICFLSDLPFIRLYLPMKSISNSDHIYFGIACQKSIPRFLLISVKYLCLSTFPKVADLIGGQSVIASHFLWQVCQTGKCISGTLRSTKRPTPFTLFLYSRRLEGVNAPNQSPTQGVWTETGPPSWRAGKGNRLSVFPAVRSCWELLCAKWCSLTLKQWELICSALKSFSAPRSYLTSL